MAKEVSAGAVIFRKENDKVFYLLLHYEAGHWDYVKGHIEQGEDEIATIRRETEEETGIKDLEFMPDFKNSIHYFYQRGKKTMSKDVHFHLAMTKTKTVKISHEHIGYEWLEYKDAMERITFKNSKETLRKADEYLSKH